MAFSTPLALNLISVRDSEQVRSKKRSSKGKQDTNTIKETSLTTMSVCEPHLPQLHALSSVSLSIHMLFDC